MLLKLMLDNVEDGGRKKAETGYTLTHKRP